MPAGICNIRRIAVANWVCAGLDTVDEVTSVWDGVA